MRKYQWFVIVILIGCIVSFAGCERIKQVVGPDDVETTPPDTAPEMPEEPVVETPADTETEMSEEPVDEAPADTETEMPEETVVETPPETQPEMPEEVVPEGTFVSIDPAQITSPKVGEQLQVSIQIGQAVDVAGYEFKLTFDPEALKYVTGSNADYLPPGALPILPDPQDVSDSVYVSAISLSGATVDPNGTLATVTFEVLAVKASTLTLSEVILADSDAEEVQPRTENGEISAP